MKNLRVKEVKGERDNGKSMYYPQFKKGFFSRWRNFTPEMLNDERYKGDVIKFRSLDGAIYFAREQRTIVESGIVYHKID